MKNMKQREQQKIAYVSIPTSNTDCNCCCEKTMVTIPQTRNVNTFDNKEKLLQMITELEISYTSQINSMKDNYEARSIGQDKSIQSLKAENAHLNNEAKIVRQQNSRIRNQIGNLTTVVEDLKSKLIVVEKQKQNIVRNKVSFIESNLTEKNLYLQNEINCLKQHHDNELRQLLKSHNQARQQYQQSISRLEDEKQRQARQIEALRLEGSKYFENKREQQSISNMERTRKQQYLRQTDRMKLEMKFQAQLSRVEINHLKEKMETLVKNITILESAVDRANKQKQVLHQQFQQSKVSIESNFAQDRDRELRLANQRYAIKVQEIESVHQQRYAKLKQQQEIDLKRRQQQWKIKYQGLQREMISKLEEAQAKLMNQTIKPAPKPEIKKQYIYIQKQIQSPDFRIVSERLVQANSEIVTLLAKIQDLQFENNKIKQRIHYFGNLEESFNSERLKWKKQRAQLMAALEKASQGHKQNNFQWVVEQIIQSQNTYGYSQICNPDLRIVPTSEPNVTYRVLSSEDNIEKLLLQQRQRQRQGQL